MVIILSPSKDMVENALNSGNNNHFTLPQYLDKAERLINQLRKRDPKIIAEQMHVNEKLAMLNYMRFQHWTADHAPENSLCSILSYTGEAYRGLRAADFSSDEFDYSQHTLRILSGLYGMLRPLDLIQPYRLEIGLGIPFNGINNLYDFWRESVTKSLNQAIADSPGDKVLINLASAEYSSVINFKKIKYRVIMPSFKEEKSGVLKMVTVYTKHARGAMTRFIIQNRIENIEELKAFSDDGYYFENQLSKGNNLLFVR